MQFKKEEILESKTKRDEAIIHLIEGVQKAVQEKGLTISEDSAKGSAIDMLCRMFDLPDDMKSRIKLDYTAS